MTWPAPDWRRLAEFGFKPDKRLRDRVTQALQGRYHSPPIGWRTLLEGYVERQDRIDVVLGRQRARHYEGFAHDANAPEFCATFEWPESPLFDDLKAHVLCEAGRGRNAVRPPCFADVVEADEDVGEVWAAVLIDVPKLVENPELVTLGIALPTVKRLQLLELRDKTRVDTTEAIDRLIGRPLCGIDDDGESDLPPLVTTWDGIRRWRTAELVGECPDEVVEGGAEVVGDIPDHHSELVCGRVGDGCAVDDDVLGFDVYVGVDFVRLRLKDTQRTFERADVYVRPLDPFETESVGIIHER